MSVFTSGGAKPVGPDFNKLLEGGAGAVAGGTPANLAPPAPIDGFSIRHCGDDKDIALVVTVTVDTAAGYVLAGDATQVVPAGGSVSITLDDMPADSDAITGISIAAVSLSAITPSATVTLGSALPAAGATDVVPYIINTIES